MKLAIIISSNDPETVWNAFRLGVYALKAGDAVAAFLLGKGVEAEQLRAANFDVPDMMGQFFAAGGSVLACGTCLKLRQEQDSGACSISTMKDLYELVRDHDKVLTF